MMRTIAVYAGKLLRPLFARKRELGHVHKICIFKTGAIGDVLMSTPFLESIRKRFPHALIDYWVGNWAVDALYGNPHVDAVYGFDPKFTYGGYHKTFAKLWKLAREIRREGYDIQFTLDRSYLSVLFGSILCWPRIHVGFDRHGEGFANNMSVQYRKGLRQHDIQYYLDLARAVGGPEVEPTMKLYLSDEHETWAEEFLKEHEITGDIAGIAPSGGNPGQEIAGRQWPITRFLRVVQALEKEGKTVLLFGSPADRETLKQITQESNALIVKTPTILHAAAVMKHCRVVISNDAGLMHVAAAVHTPTVSVFGMTDPLRKAPLGKKHTYLWKPIPVQKAEVFGIYTEEQKLNITKVTVHEVLKAIEDLNVFK